MKLLRVSTNRTLSYTPCGGRIVSLAIPLTISYYTDEGVFSASIDAGFKWDGRSGPLLVDIFVPNQGTEEEALMWLFHDVGGYPDTISAELGNVLLRQRALLLGYGPKIAGLIYGAVSATKSKWKAYNWNEVDHKWICNRDKIRFHYSDK